MTEPNLYCALLTPLGRGAIATIGVRGPGAVESVGRCFRPAAGKPLHGYSAGRVVFGRFRTAAGAPEELVVGLAGEDELEIQCHGGTAAVEAIVAALIAQGCQQISWQDWASIHEPDPIAAGAAIALALARTERAAAILLDQRQGALRSALEAILRQLEHCDVLAASRSLDELLSRAELGRHLTRPWRIVLAGTPNVGKSSLINALLGYQRAIVFDQPGTTRDVLTATTAIDGWPVELADTAGLREGASAIEAEGIARALQRIAAADLVIQVIDATASWAGQEGSEFRVQGSGGVVIVHNKCDLVAPPADGRPAGLNVSAKTGQGIEPLCQAIVERWVPHPPPRGAALPFTEGQIAAIEMAHEQLNRGDLSAAKQAVESLLTPDPRLPTQGPCYSSFSGTGTGAGT